MSVWKQWRRRRIAHQRASDARRQLAEPAASLLARAYRHPLRWIAAAGASGFALGQLNVHPLRINGAAAALGGGITDLLLKGARLLATVGLDKVLEGMGKGKPAAADEEGTDEDADMA